MKKYLCFLLSVAMILGLCACGLPTSPVETEPSTFPTEPEATEPEATEPSTSPTDPTPPEEDPPMPLDWTEFAFRLDGVLYQLPCDFSELMDNGWSLAFDTSNIFPLGSYSRASVSMEKGSSIVTISLVNPGATPAQPEQCKLEWLFVSEYLSSVSMELAHSISNDISNCQQILEAFGDPPYVDWYGVGDDGGEPISICFMRYETEIGYDQHMAFYIDFDGTITDISLGNFIQLPDRDDEPDAPCVHEYIDRQIAATCTAPGSITFTCSLCGDTQTEVLLATGHSYQDGACSVCGAADPSVPIEVSYTVTVRSDKGKPVEGVTVSIYTNNSSTPAAVGQTNAKGVATMTLMVAPSYEIVLTNVPSGLLARESYIFGSTQVNINLTTIPQISPDDHSKANYKVGSTMGDFTLTDTDGNSYTLSDLLKEKDLVILNFWFVNCGPCKAEFPYFEEIYKIYGNIQLLTLNHMDDADDIVALRQEMGVSFPMIAENIGFQQGFGLEAYPTTVFISKTSKILKIQVGEFKSAAELENMIERFL